MGNCTTKTPWTDGMDDRKIPFKRSHLFLAFHDRCDSRINQESRPWKACAKSIGGMCGNRIEITYHVWIISNRSSSLSADKFRKGLSRLRILINYQITPIMKSGEKIGWALREIIFPKMDFDGNCTNVKLQNSSFHFTDSVTHNFWLSWFTTNFHTCALNYYRD